ncbi:hypothetical protein LI056_08175 [Clostridium perfringens]|uniref:hypothetical protein n=1 Tax=Clostridium perfringens TaxID=1502 RepID=UPI001F194D47|nr:hypothetical protein [Clostridium perfringens]MCX0357967.1 hypothetical protein [Clostridium perfringens]MCX0407238.1 hypothetical protein [Clostridium perfringens]MCX0418946.1 hypothetical protein [Clostridium perfringens]MDK0574172.1 hypothetical protein [Clostridium perfringens]MDM0537761.1 hypothetical protein [Clostridium perfringens]
MCTLEEMKKFNEDFKKELKDKMINFFNDYKGVNNKIDVDNILSKSVKIHRIKKYKDLGKISKNTGFYIILSDYKYDNNICEFIIEREGISLKAIYRGQSSDKYSRLEGHLFKQKIDSDKKDINFMKVNKENGINIDKSPYNKYKWFVIEYKLNKITQDFRLIMEEAFVEVFKKPIFSDK